MRIGDLARDAGCDVETVRYYERSGLLDPPPRDQSGYRRYGQDDLERLQFIRYCRHLQLGTRHISALIELKRNPAAACSEVNELLDKQIDRVQEQIINLRRLEELLLNLRQQCKQPNSIQDCGILQNLDDEAKQTEWARPEPPYEPPPTPCPSSDCSPPAAVRAPQDFPLK